MKTVLSVAMLVALASTAQAKEPSPAPGACPGIVTKAVTVDGRNDEWTATGIKVKANDVVLLMAGGAVKVGEFTGEVSANGVGNVANGNGRLTAKVGTGTVLSVGEKWFGAFEQDAGPLKLKVQDTNHTDNGGEFKVILLVIPGCAIPEPEEVAAE
jgi:hypothetical protein